MTPEWDIAPPSLHAALPKCNIHYRISNLWDREGRGGATCSGEGRREAEGEPHTSRSALSLAPSLCLRASCRRARKYIFSQVARPPARLTCTRSSRSQRRRWRSKSLGRERRDEGFPQLGNRVVTYTSCTNRLGYCDYRTAGLGTISQIVIPDSLGIGD